MNPLAASFFPPPSQAPVGPGAQHPTLPHKPPPDPSKGIAGMLSGLTGGIPAPNVIALATGAGQPLHGPLTGPVVKRNPPPNQIAQALFQGNPVNGKDAQ